jgi:chromosome segregation ATPase
MSIQAPRLRRLATVVAVIAALVVGYGSIRAAAAWTAASAPLSVAPVPVSELQDRLAVEQARSADLRAQLETLTERSTEMAVALEAAQSQIAGDTDHANALAKELKDAKKKLAKLEASIAKAKRAAQRPTIVVTKTKTKTVAASAKHHEDEHEEDEHEEDHD